MKPHLVAYLIVACSASLHAGSPEGKTQQLTSTEKVPEGLAKSDWSSIRAAYEAGRHAFQPVPGRDGVWQARNPGQQWLTTFDQRGFEAKPAGGDWSWGLELKSYGFGEKQTLIGGTPTVKAAGQRLSYQWNAAVQEWWVNDQRGLEHGFTLSERPPLPVSSSPASPLTFILGTRGNLKPKISADELGVQFQDSTGDTVLNYSGLKVWDADGKVLPSRFEPAGLSSFRLLVDDAAAHYPITIDPIAQQAYLKASQVNGNDYFGYSVAVSGETVVVGAIEEDSNTTGVNSTPNELASNAGAAYVFVRSGVTWSQQAYLKASQVSGSDYFGYSVAVSGDTVVVGAIEEDSSTTGVNSTPNDGVLLNAGAAYVFVRSGSSWTQQAYLKADQVNGDDFFGHSVAVSGDTVVVGANAEDSSTTGVNSSPNESASSAGAAYVFVRSSSSWTQQAYLKASQVSVGDNFGWSVAVSGDTVVVGAYFEDSSTTGVNSTSNELASDAGAAYVFVRSGSSWTQQAYLKADQVDAWDNFGYSVAVSGDTVVVGASLENSSTTGVNSTPNGGASWAGAAYVFVRNGSSWSQQAYLKASQVTARDRFGRSVAVSGDTVVVGAPYEDSNTTGVNSTPNEALGLNGDAGAAYVFVRSGSSWTQQAYLKASQVTVSDWFGHSVAVSGDTVVVGASLENSSTTGVNSTPNELASYSGAAYIFTGLGPAPTVTNVAPASGSTAGGTNVTITGTGFTGTPTVTIGGVAATSVVVVDATTITAVTPAGTAGTASVLVTTPGGTNAANMLYTFDAPGDLDSSDANVSGGSVFSTAAQPDGKTIIVGSFTSVKGLARNFIARLNADGTLDADFNPNSNGWVYSVAVQIDGKILFGGAFSTMGGSVRSRIARANADGTLDVGFNPNSNSNVHSVAVQTDGKILIGGDFTSVGGSMRNRIARMDANGTLDASFNPNANQLVRSIVVQGDGKILFGGKFTNVGGAGRNRIARVAADGTLDATFNPNVNNIVYSIAVQADGKILMGGEFTTVGGITRNRIARISSTGSLDEIFNPNANNFVDSIALQADGKILLGGWFTSVGGAARNYIAQVYADGTIVADFDPNSNNQIFSVNLRANGQIWLGGNFTNLQPNGAAIRSTRNYIALLQNAPATQILSAADTSNVLWIRGGSSPEISQVTLEQSIDGGATWTLLGSAERVGLTSNWQLTGLSLPGSGQLRARGRASGGYFNGSSGLVEQVVAFSGLLPAPSISVAQVSPLIDGVGNVDFGTSIVGSSSAPLTFTITNTGTADLTGLVVTKDGTNASDFTVSALSSTSIPVGTSTVTFTVTFSTDAVGAKSATLHIGSNVSGTKNPFDIAITGVGAPSLSLVTIISNNTNTTRAKLANTVTLSFTVSEIIQTPSVTLLGVAATVANVSGNNWTATASVGAGTAEGVAAFSISATDIAGNAAPAVTATTNGSSVTVDKTMPGLFTVAIASNNANTARAKLANTVTLSFTANEVIQTPSVTLLGVAATVANPSGNNWTATATVGAGTAEGLAAFSLSTSDLAGNVASLVTSTTNSSSVTVDKTLPVLTSVTIASDNSNTARAKLANTVTLSFTASEAIQTPSVTLLGVAATVANPSGKNWTATATVGAGTAEGVAAFSITVTDLADNAAAVTMTTNASSVTVDKTIPSITSVTITSNNANTARAKLSNTVTLSFTASETIQTPAVVMLGAAATVANPSGNNWTATRTVTAGTAAGVATFSISASDLTGNIAAAVTATTNSSSVTVDKTGPTLALPSDISVDTNNLNGVAVNFTVTATDALDPAPTVSATPVSGSIFPIGTTTVNVTATDAAGNSSPGSFKVTVTRITPEIVVQDSAGTNLMSGSSTVDFGASGVGGSVSKTFTVRNTGTYQLTGLGITIDNTADFAVTAPPATPVLPGESTTFTVKFQPGTLGTTSTVLHLTSNDDDEPSFEFALVGRSHALSFNGSSLTQREDAVTIKVPVQLSSAFGAAFSVPFTIGGTATIADYTITTPSPVKFTATQTVAYISITIKDDLIEEGDETLILTLGTPSFASVTVVSPSVFTITITEDDVMPVIAPLLVSQIVAVGDPVNFPSGATGSAPLALVWKKNGVVIAGETTGSYGFAPATLTHGADYSITATNQRGSVSSTAQLAVVDRSDAIIRANVGSSPTLTVNATGSALIYRWRDANGDLPVTGTKYAGVTTKTLTVKNVVTGDAGHYTCRVTGPGGSMLSGDRHLQVPSLKPITDTPALPDVVAYNNFSYQLTFDPDAARAPTKYVCSGLPAGLTCNVTTGLISGTPTRTGDFTVLVTLSNSAGAADTVQDTFSVFKYPAGAVGVYAGVMGRDMKANINLGGRIDLTTTITGGYTGTLRLGATAYPLNGTLRTAPTAGAHPGVTLSIVRSKQLPVLLVLDLDPASNDLTGTVSEQGSTTNAMIMGWRNVWRTTATPTANPVVGQLGAHSFKIDPATTGPQGYGYGTVNVTNTGGTTVGGRTADGEVITTTGVLGPDGEVLVYSMLYISKGSILGTMGIDINANHSIDSTLDWQKTQATTARDYTPFGPLNVAVLGGKYSVTTPLLQLPSLSVTVTDNAQFTFSDAGVPSATNPNMRLRISNTNVLTLNPTNPGKINSLVFTPTTGAFGGKMTLTDPPALPRTVAFQGWLVPTLGKGYGYFLLPQLANPLATPPTTATTSPILSGKVLLEAVTR